MLNANRHALNDELSMSNFRYFPPLAHRRCPSMYRLFSIRFRRRAHLVAGIRTMLFVFRPVCLCCDMAMPPLHPVPDVGVAVVLQPLTESLGSAVQLPPQRSFVL